MNADQAGRYWRISQRYEKAKRMMNRDEFKAWCAAAAAECNAAAEPRRGPPRPLTKPERHLVRQAVRHATREAMAITCRDMTAAEQRVAVAELRKRGFCYDEGTDVWLFARRHRGLELVGHERSHIMQS